MSIVQGAKSCGPRIHHSGMLLRIMLACAAIVAIHPAYSDELSCKLDIPLETNRAVSKFWQKKSDDQQIELAKGQSLYETADKEYRDFVAAKKDLDNMPAYLAEARGLKEKANKEKEIVDIIYSVVKKFEDEVSKCNIIVQIQESQ